MVLCFAFEYIKLIDHVTLSGYVKTATMRKWSHILANKRDAGYQQQIEDMKAEFSARPGTEL